jgi:3-hydroxyacyl-CoA dehydrogenase
MKATRPSGLRRAREAPPDDRDREAKAALARLHPRRPSTTRAPRVDFVVEAVFEDLDVKHR